MKTNLIFFHLLVFSAFNIYSQYETYSLDQLIGKKYCKTCTSHRNFLQKETFEAYLKMKNAAKKDGIEIQIVSGNRNFERQQYIFNRKFKKYTSQGLPIEKTLNKIIEFSTIPGTSRHHWGTDIDIIQKITNTPKNLLLASNFEKNGPFCRLKEWMDLNASKFGFYLVYTNNSQRTGFKYEPWHYSYKPISKKLLKDYIKFYEKGEIWSSLSNNNVKINSIFFKNYIHTHIKGINTQLIE